MSNPAIQGRVKRNPARASRLFKELDGLRRTVSVAMVRLPSDLDDAVGVGERGAEEAVAGGDLILVDQQIVGVLRVVLDRSLDDPRVAGPAGAALAGVGDHHPGPQCRRQDRLARGHLETLPVGQGDPDARPRHAVVLAPTRVAASAAAILASIRAWNSA